MAKGIGLIGNFKGKVGNMVGYQLSDSNTGNTQGIRVYQPNVKNPKTSAQAEQRAKLAPINATYRALKMIIDRGNEGLPYGNKSRLAWMKQAFKAEHMPWILKGATVTSFVCCPITKGSLAGLPFDLEEDHFFLHIDEMTSSTNVSTIGAVSTLLVNQYPSLQNGDQITIVFAIPSPGGISAIAHSFLVSTTSTETTSLFEASTEELRIPYLYGSYGGSVIVSRQGANGEHLRSNSSLKLPIEAYSEAPFTEASKTAAIESYMASDSVNSDWAEESIQ